MDTWITLTILIISTISLLYSIASNYAIRGNDLKHLQEGLDGLKEDMKCCERKLLSRIERLENIFLDKKGE